MTKLLAIKPEELLGQSDQHIHYINERVGINKQMLNAYQALVDSAQQDGIDIAIASGFRSFERQRLIWNNKFSGISPIKDVDNNIVDITSLTPIEIVHAILLYSALPGASRHHWGCDIDVYATNLLPKDYQLKLEPWEYQTSGPLAQLSLWLTKHAHQFGFYLPYKKYQGGVAAELWHISYAPLAKHYQKALTTDLLSSCFEQRCITQSNTSPANIPPENNEQALLGQNTIQENLTLIMTRYINNTNAIPDNCYNRA
ncbi:M15 family metallopeptidase [Colwellia sp. D2M02]|uniref:M15 family metallopeptidase n=1 Tax=Colwellia sp. D2M02 TaxID=2841562 RepID=UPI001C085D19|nr:M15 family metallopeptidase [Colwellia sp. D2M02]MBU2892463.1 M15 family metallopeptidase [Colwellia sp. D2M02]